MSWQEQVRRRRRPPRDDGDQCRPVSEWRAAWAEQRIRPRCDTSARRPTCVFVAAPPSRPHRPAWMTRGRSPREQCWGTSHRGPTGPPGPRRSLSRRWCCCLATSSHIGRLRAGTWQQATCNTWMPTDGWTNPTSAWAVMVRAHSFPRKILANSTGQLAKFRGSPRQNRLNYVARHGLQSMTENCSETLVIEGWHYTKGWHALAISMAVRISLKVC